MTSLLAPVTVVNKANLRLHRLSASQPWMFEGEWPQSDELRSVLFGYIERTPRRIKNAILVQQSFAGVSTEYIPVMRVYRRTRKTPKWYA